MERKDERTRVTSVSSNPRFVLLLFIIAVLSICAGVFSSGTSHVTSVANAVFAQVSQLSQPVTNPVKCDTRGTSVTLSWGSVTGASVYALRFDDPTNNTSSCADGWYCGSPDYLNDTYVKSSITRTIVPGRTYTWWVHAKKWGTWEGLSTAKKETFSCGTNFPNNYAPIGFFDSTSNGALTGWTFDPDVTSQSMSLPINVAMYMDGPKGVGQNVATVKADYPRPDVNTAHNVLGDHGFVWIIPSQYAGNHTWYIYGVDASNGDQQIHLANSPKTYTGSSCTPASPSTQTQTLACPAGQTGSITQTRTSSCLAGATSPTWSVWTTVGNTCTTIPTGDIGAGLPTAWQIGSWNPVATAISVASGVTTITENTTTGNHGVQQYLNVPASPRWQLSFDVAPVGARVVRVYLFNAQNQSIYAATMCYPSGAGSVSKWGSASAAVEASITQLSGGYYRCSLRGSLSAANANPSQLYMVIYAEQNSASSYLGDGSSGLKLRNIALTGEFSGGTAAKATAGSSLVTSLYAQREGFGANTTGGLDGDIYTVTTLADSNTPGSLRFAAADASKPYWIVFSPGLSGTITLNSPINVGANKTIDGRGSSITIANHGLNVPNANVIINNIAIRNVNNLSEDNISIYGVAAKNIWIHRVSLSGQTSDGLLDITNGATDITVDWSRFTDHDKVMIVNSYATSPDPNNPNGEILNGHEYDNQVRDSNVRLTLHHNAFIGTLQRHPRSVFAKIHMYNNVLLNWGYYGVGSSFLTQTLAEGNVFNSSGPYANQALVTQIGIDPVPGYIKAVNNLFLNGASGASSGPVFVPAYTYRCERASVALQTLVSQQAGVEGSDTTSPVPFGVGCPTP